MHNRLYQYLQGNKLPYNKPFGFQKATSTDHAIIQLLLFNLMTHLTNVTLLLVSLLIIYI